MLPRGCRLDVREEFLTVMARAGAPLPLAWIGAVPTARQMDLMPSYDPKISLSVLKHPI